MSIQRQIDAAKARARKDNAHFPTFYAIAASIVAQLIPFQSVLAAAPR